MDAFAVSVCKGVSMRKAAWKNGLLIGLVFGAFQFAMPVAGYFLGSTLSAYVEGFDHWIAFGLLTLIGIKMLVESFGSDHEACDLSLRAGEAPRSRRRHVDRRARRRIVARLP
ncbi:MAG: manganese efflux pump [Comamonadaceae bacterium]|nr:manganese efflux pump [Comamonadaceae bacterium]